jgi:hypothetical protein
MEKMKLVVPIVATAFFAVAICYAIAEDRKPISYQDCVLDAMKGGGVSGSALATIHYMCVNKFGDPRVPR